MFSRVQGDMPAQKIQKSPNLKIDLSVMAQPPSSSADNSDSPEKKLREAADAVMGDIHGNTWKSINPSSCHLFKVGIRPYVSDKSREQIWINQYFDIATLLPPPPLQTPKPQNQDSKANDNTPFIHTPDR